MKNDSLVCLNKEVLGADFFDTNIVRPVKNRGLHFLHCRSSSLGINQLQFRLT